MKMKRILPGIIMLALLLAGLALTGCSSNSDNNGSGGQHHDMPGM